MKSRTMPRRVTMVLAFLTLLFGVGAAAAVSSAAASGGWIRLGNLSENPAPVDMYVYASGNSTPQIVEHDVAYGEVLSYTPVNSGTYSVEIRDAGAAATSKPALTIGLTVQDGRSYTVVPLRTTSQTGELKVLDDSLSTPAGQSLVRVIQASFDQKSVTFHCSCGQGAKGNIVTNAPPGSVSMYATIPPGDWTMTATGPSAKASPARHADREHRPHGGRRRRTQRRSDRQPDRCRRRRPAAHGRRRHRVRRHRPAGRSRTAAVAGGHRRRRTAQRGRLACGCAAPARGRAGTGSDG